VIDTHCHLLPGLDDGPRESAASLDLAQQLAAAGVEFVLCTPHFSRRFPTSVALARERLVGMRGALSSTGIDLELGLAAELSPALAVSAPAEDLEARAVGSFLLVELEPDTPAGFTEMALERLGREGLRPIFAHPERCRAMRVQPRLLDEARAAGALVQVVAASLVGRWGAATAESAWRLLEAGAVDLLASDAHGWREDGSHLERAAALVAERLGTDVLEDLTERAPARVVGLAPQPA
jgi:protein-tyrosine phosphatase